MKVIGLTGYATAGKDCAAQALIALGWERVSFADPLREMALAIDPIVDWECVHDAWQDAHKEVPIHLSAVVGANGWGEAKKSPEVRRLLQKIGTEAVRNIIGKNTWVDIAARKIHESAAPGVVITDVRFANEASTIRNMRGEIYRIDKPGVGPVNGHISDDAIHQLRVDGVILNDGTIEDLHAKMRQMVAPPEQTMPRCNECRKPIWTPQEAPKPIDANE